MVARVNLDQQIGRMAEALDRGVTDRRELLDAINRLDASVDNMNGVLGEMRAAFQGIIRRMETVEADGDRCEKLAKRVEANERRIESIEIWRNHRRRTMAAIATGFGAIAGSIATTIIQLIWRHH